jgi:cytochrome oxidase Cu insertion factor (SCO1/SenC/PrrC family)
MSTRRKTILWAIGAGLIASLGAVILIQAKGSKGPSDPRIGSPSPTGVDARVVDLSTHLAVPDTPLVDHRGRSIQFYSDLVKGQVVAINFIFTTCQGVCPPMGTTFRKLEERLDGRGVRLISVSVDPVNDTPETMAAWAKKYHAGPDWTLVTGRKQDVDVLLRTLGVFSADKANHSPFILVGNDLRGVWKRIHGLSPPAMILSTITDLTGPPSADGGPDSPGLRYFTDVPLVNQDGRTVRLYSDLIRDRVVVMHTFFSSCENTCPLMLATYQKLQDHLGGRLGRDVLLISFTVDPANDDPDRLNQLANRIETRPGWHMVTGTPDNLKLALGKLGLAIERREDHSNIFLIGNDRTHLWKKVRGLAPAEQIIQSLDDVINDPGPDPTGQDLDPTTSRMDGTARR